MSAPEAAVATDEKVTGNRMASIGGANLRATTDVNQIEAPVTWKAYLMCAFASFGGIFFGMFLLVYTFYSVDPFSQIALQSYQADSSSVQP